MSVYLATNILNAVVPFILIPILTRVLSPEEYGEVGMFQMLMVGLSSIIGLSGASAASRKYFDVGVNDEHISHFVGCCFQVLIYTLVVSLLVVVCIEDYVANLLGIKIAWVYAAIAVSAGTFITQMLLSQWQVRKKPGSYGLFQLSMSAINLGLTLLFVKFFVLAGDGRVLAFLLNVFIFSLIALLILKRKGMLIFFIWNKKYIKEIFTYGWPLIPHVFGGFLIVMIDRFYINLKFGLYEVGIYVLAVQVAGIMSMVFQSINNAYVPWLFERLKTGYDHDKIKIVTYTYCWYLLIAVIVLLGFVFGPAIIVLVAGPKYESAGDIFGWIVLGQGFYGMYLMVTNYLFYAKKTFELSLVTISVGLMNVFLLLFLLDKMGVIGAAVSFSISMLSRFILTWYLAHKHYPMPWFNFRWMTSFLANKNENV